MTRPIEQELTALFNDAVAHLEIQPFPARRSRAATVTRALAAGLATAVVAALVLLSLRLAGNGSERTLPAGPGDSSAAQEVLDALTRTWAQPVRIETTLTMDESPSAPGAPDPAPQTTTAVAEVDTARDAAVLWQQGGPPTVMAIDGHLYVAITDSDRTGSELPADARWYEAPAGSAPALTDFLVIGGTGRTNPDTLRAGLAAGRVDIAAGDSPGTYLVTEQMATRGPKSDPDAALRSRETVHVDSAGLVDWLTVTYAFSDDQRTMTSSAQFEPLDRQVRAEAPDPSTVISAEEFTKLTTPATTTECSASGGTIATTTHEPTDPNSATAFECGSANAPVRHKSR